MTTAIVVAAIVLALVAVAWAMGWIRRDTVRTEWLGLQRVDSDFDSYRTVEFAWSLIRAGVAESGRHEAYLKVHDAGGRLALCGYMLMRHGGQSQNAMRWLADARVNIAGHAFSARFINAAPPGFSPADAQAGCVVSAVPWDPAFAAAPVTFSGPAVSLTK